MTLKEALATGKPFKAKHHEWWHDPENYPGYLVTAALADWHGDNWEVIDEIPEAQKEFENKILERKK